MESLNLLSKPLDLKVLFHAFVCTLIVGFWLIMIFGKPQTYTKKGGE